MMLSLAGGITITAGILALIILPKTGTRHAPVDVQLPALPDA